MVEYDPSKSSDDDPFFPAVSKLRALDLVRSSSTTRGRFPLEEVCRSTNPTTSPSSKVFVRRQAAAHNAGAPETAPRRPVPSFAAVDPPLHTQLRQSMYPSFTPRACRDLAREVDEMVECQLDTLDGTTRFDVVAEFASPVAVVSTLRFLGLPLTDADALRRLINASTTR